jgi:uridylate kinase
MFQEGGETSSPDAGYLQSSNVFVVSIGGSILFEENEPSPEKFKAIVDVVTQLHRSGKKIVLVVGGGKVARLYSGVAGSLNLNKFEQDLVGIKVTRLNASLLAAATPDAHKKVLEEIVDAKNVLDNGKIPVFGGLVPFFTTDSVAALLAEFLNGVFVNLTDVDGIYDSNPKENPDAVMFSEISYSRLVSLAIAAGSAPGQNVVVDIACAMILKRSKIPAVFLNGNNLDNFMAYINGQSFVGTVVRDIPEDVSNSNLSDVGGFPDSVVVGKKKPRKRRSKKPVVGKSKDDYSHPDPYQIDF